MHICMIWWRHNIFRVTGRLCGAFTGHRWIHRTKASDAELWCFSLICAWIDGWVNRREAGDLWRHCAHHDVTVMNWAIIVSGNVLANMWSSYDSLSTGFIGRWVAIEMHSQLLKCCHTIPSRNMSYKRKPTHLTSSIWNHMKSPIIFHMLKSHHGELGTTLQSKYESCRLIWSLWYNVVLCLVLLDLCIGSLTIIFSRPLGILKPTEALGRVVSCKFKLQSENQCQGTHSKSVYLTLTKNTNI